MISLQIMRKNNSLSNQNTNKKKKLISDAESEMQKLGKFITINLKAILNT